jgi:hypothetical protein
MPIIMAIDEVVTLILLLQNLQAKFARDMM